MEKYKYLIKNIGLMAISQFGAKAMTFILVPLYTSVLSTTEYGTYDIFNTFVSLLLPVLTLNIFDAVLRFSLDDENDKAKVLGYSLSVSFKGSLILILVVACLTVFHFFPQMEQFYIAFVVLYVATALNTILSNYARGIDQVRTMAVAGIISTASMLVFNVLFLLVMHWGLHGYFWANSMGLMVGVFYYFVRLTIWKSVSFPHNGLADLSLKRKMRAYSMPMILNSLSWWINISSLRYSVLFFLGISANGIFSVAYKIPNIINIFSTVFSSAWTLSSVKSFDQKDESGFFSKIYNLYNFLMVLATAAIISLTKVLAHVLYANDFYMAWKLVPFITISALFSAIAGYLGGIFTAVKSTREFASSTLISAIINVVLGALLVWQIGLIGAAIAVMTSSYALWIVRLIQSKKYITIKFHVFRDHLAYITLLVQSVLMLVLSDSLFLYLIQCGFAIIVMALFWQELRGVVSKGVHRFLRK